MKLTKEQLAKMLPTCKNIDQWVDLLNTHLEKFGIVTVQQTAFFIAQCGHESNDFNTTVENLNYSNTALLSVFGKYFGPPPKKNADMYARQQDRIANVVYANRLGNGPEESGDGFRYRGRGLVQITGKANYTECSKFLYGDDTLVKNPDLVTKPLDALKSALWFWQKNKLAEVQDFHQLTLKINGGTNGEADRVSRLAACIKALT